jgi:bifunctional DNA-binding transcriptional regulator/antitoxin component of YhaV-PrlF toxin-antitoxin module
MNQTIKLTVDETGQLIIPTALQSLLGLSPGMTLIVEQGEADELKLRVQAKQKTIIQAEKAKPSSALGRKNGILIIQGELLTDISNVVQTQREQRLTELIEQTGLV